MGRYRSELYKKITNYGLDKHNYWKNIKLGIERSVFSEDICKIMLYKVDQIIEHLIDFPDFLHRLPPDELLHGKNKPDVPIGKLVDNPEMEIGIHFRGPLFILIAGLTGYGKTTTVRTLLTGIEEYNQRNPDKKVVVIVFDRKGGDYADLPGKFGWKHYHVYNSLKQSLENPKQIAPGIWIDILCGLFCARTGLKYSRVTMSRALKTLLGVLNPKAGKRLIWPDFRLLLDFLKSCPENTFSTKPEYVRSLKQQLEDVVNSAYKTFEAFQGLRIEELIERGESAVIATPIMEPGGMRQLLVDINIIRVLKSRIESSHRVDSTEVLFVVEEADDDVNAGVESLFSNSMSPISECFKRGREFGVGVCVNVSSLNSVSALIRENATNYFMFRTSGDPAATNSAAAALTLPPYGALSLPALSEGQCIMRQSGPWHHAMKAQINYTPPSRIHVTKYDSHQYIPSKKLTSMPIVLEAVKNVRKAHQKNRKSLEKKTETQIDKLAYKLLHIAAANPYIPVARLFESIGSPRPGDQKHARKLLTDNKFAVFDEIRIGRTNMLLIEVTEKGFRHLDLQPDISINKGGGDLVHRTFSHWIRLYFEAKGCQAFIEWPIPENGHRVDTVVYDGDSYHAYEIAVTATTNLTDHAKACFEKSKSIETLTIITALKSSLDKLSKSLAANLCPCNYISIIKFETIKKYIPTEVKNEID